MKDDDREAFFVVRKGDLVGVYKSLSDYQAQVGTSICCDPSVRVYKGYSMPKDAESYLLSCGLKNALYSIRASDLTHDRFGTLVPCSVLQEKDEESGRKEESVAPLELWSSAKKNESVAPLNDPGPSSRAFDSVVRNDASQPPQKNIAFRMSVPEDFFEQDDDVHDNGIAPTPPLPEKKGPTEVPVVESNLSSAEEPKSVNTTTQPEEVKSTSGFVFNKTTEFGGPSSGNAGESSGSLAVSASEEASKASQSAVIPPPSITFDNPKDDHPPVFSLSSSVCDKFPALPSESTSKASEPKLDSSSSVINTPAPDGLQLNTPEPNNGDLNPSTVPDFAVYQERFLKWQRLKTMFVDNFREYVEEKGYEEFSELEHWALEYADHRPIWEMLRPNFLDGIMAIKIADWDAEVKRRAELHDPEQNAGPLKINSDVPKAIKVEPIPNKNQIAPPTVGTTTTGLSAPSTDITSFTSTGTTGTSTTSPTSTSNQPIFSFTATTYPSTSPSATSDSKTKTETNQSFGSTSNPSFPPFSSASSGTSVFGLTSSATNSTPINPQTSPFSSATVPQGSSAQSISSTPFPSFNTNTSTPFGFSFSNSQPSNPNPTSIFGNPSSSDTNSAGGGDKSSQRIVRVTKNRNKTFGCILQRSARYI